VRASLLRVARGVGRSRLIRIRSRRFRSFHPITCDVVGSSSAELLMTFTLEHLSEIERFEAARWKAAPWLPYSAS
jgi:hypothetical protein